jgi:hypothetical protein
MRRRLKSPKGRNRPNAPGNKTGRGTMITPGNSCQRRRSANGGSARSELWGDFCSASLCPQRMTRMRNGSILSAARFGLWARVSVVEGKTLDTLNPLKTRGATLLRRHDQAPPNSGANRIAEGQEWVNPGSPLWTHPDEVSSPAPRRARNPPKPWPSRLSCIAYCNYACSTGPFGLHWWAICARPLRATPPVPGRPRPTQETPGCIAA